jgi:diguanylate cyclase (GGDEF)-like protein
MNNTTDAEELLFSMKKFLFEYFQKLGPDPIQNISVIVDTVGKVLKPAVALYNRLEKGKLVTLSIYNEPPDYLKEDDPGGHICYEMTICERSSANLAPVVLNNLEGMRWEEDDLNVKKYGIKSYMAVPIPLDGGIIGSLCIVNTDRKEFSQIEADILESFAKAITLEEERNLTIEKLAKANKELKQNNLLIEQLALTDPLTSLSNRRDILAKIKDETLIVHKENFTQQKRKDIKNFVIAIADIDFFKKINDQYGHDCGDYILVEISKIMKSMLRLEDQVARWGGEEFLLLLTRTDINGGFTAVEKIRKKVESNVFHYEGNNINVTMTFGLVEYNSSENDVETCIKKADLALYDGKHKSRNCSIMYQEQVCYSIDV